ncbi:MAG: hypothetical protein IPK55_11360 [Streptococcus sp.]|nr:hypothetical protein [Streptococcus sp.]
MDAFLNKLEKKGTAKTEEKKKKFVWDQDPNEGSQEDMLKPKIASSVVGIPKNQSAIHTSAINLEKERLRINPNPEEVKYPKIERQKYERDSLDDLNFEGGEFGDLDFEDLLDDIEEEVK